MTDAAAPLHVLEIVGDPTGGIRRHVHSLLNGLDPARFRLSYAYDDVAADRTFAREIVELRPRLAATLPLTIRKAPHPGDIANIWRLVRFMRANGVQVVHGHGAKGGLYARIAGRLAGARSVYTPHGGAAHDMFAWPASTIYRLVERALAPLTDAFVFESRYTAEAMAAKLGHAPANAVINPNGIEPLSVSDEAEQRARAVLAAVDGNAAVRFGVFGMLREQKGQQNAIDALALVRALTKARSADSSSGLNASLHLFGGGPGRAALAARAAAAGVGDAVHFHGDVSPVEPWLAAVDAVLIPSLFESFGYVAVEAMMLARPVIASATGGLVDVLGDDCDSNGERNADDNGDDNRVACLVPPADAVALAAAMREFFAHRAAWQVIAARGRARARQKYSASAMVAGVAAVYTRLARGETKTG